MSDIEKRGHTFDPELGRDRPLNDEEQTKLIELRRGLLDEGREFVPINRRRYNDALKGKPLYGRVTVAFDNEDDYVRFTDATFGRGLEFTDVPVEWSCTVTPELLREVHGKLAVRPVLLRDFQRQARRTVSPYLFNS